MLTAPSRAWSRQTAAGFIELAGQAFLLSDLAAALENYDQAVAIEPKSADALAGRALALLWQGRLTEAQTSALRAVSHVPTHLVALNVLAQVAFAQEDFRRAFNYCDCVLALDSTDADASALREEAGKKLHRYGSFDSYVSFGFNCEAGFQFQRLGWSQSSFFRFALVPFPALRSVLVNDFAGSYQRENLVPFAEGMVMDRHTGIAFHSKLRSRFDAAAGQLRFTNDYDFEKIHRQEWEKAHYLAEKWRRLAMSDAHTLYFLKYDGSDARQHGEWLRDLIASRYPRHDFLILMLQTHDRAEADWNTDRLVNRYLPRFCHPMDAQNGDGPSWNLIFEDFPLRKGLAVAPQPMNCESDFDHLST